MEPVNFDRSVWLDHSSPRSLVVAVFSPRFFPVSNSLRGRIRPKPESLPLSDTYLSCLLHPAMQGDDLARFFS